MSNNSEIHQNGISSESSLCKMVSKHSVENYNSTYVLHTAVNSESDALLAVALSNNTIKVFKGFDLRHSEILKGHEKQITGLKFSKEQPNTLFSSSLDGNLNIWDTRCESALVQSLSDTSDDILKPLSCFDINADERIICTGTEIVRIDTFLLFWDLRTKANLGGYWDSHTDDVTQVQFHPSESSRLASGSVDGLINIFDINQGSEDDALLHTLNTESSVSKINWIASNLPKKVSDHISCITHTEEYQLWSCEEAHPLMSYDKFSKKLKEDKTDYFIDSFSLGSNVCVASGTKSGDISLWLMKKKLALLTTLKNLHKDVVRTMTWSQQNNILVSGGEDGLVCVWSCSFD